MARAAIFFLYLFACAHIPAIISSFNNGNHAVAVVQLRKFH